MDLAVLLSVYRFQLATSVYFPINKCIYIYLPIYPFIYLPINPSIHLIHPIHLSTYSMQTSRYLINYTHITFGSMHVPHEEVAHECIGDDEWQDSMCILIRNQREEIEQKKQSSRDHRNGPTPQIFQKTHGKIFENVFEISIFQDRFRIREIVWKGRFLSAHY